MHCTLRGSALTRLVVMEHYSLILHKSINLSVEIYLIGRPDLQSLLSSYIMKGNMSGSLNEF